MPPTPPTSSGGRRNASSSLFSTSALEPRDELDERHERAFALVQSLVANKGEKEAHDALLNAVSRDAKSHEEICIGLLVTILGSNENESESDEAASTSARAFRDLALVARDSLLCVVNYMTHLATEKWSRLHLSAKQQFLWLTRELIRRGSVQGMDNLCWILMRQIAGGDVAKHNLWLAETLLDILIEFRQWLERFPFLVASAVYTYLRLIEDHFHLERLRDKEAKFVSSLIKEKFQDVLAIGRDLVRVLQYVARVPHIEAIWRELLFTPNNLAPNFTGINQLMQMRTSRRFLQSRMTPDMEKKLVFLTSQVRFGTHKRYQEWFQRQYLSTNESQSLRSDLIRFIVGVIHPTNELLCSDIIPRWAIIGWLLTTCTSPVAAANAKLALFYDWLYFDPVKDNIMNIEPAILVMHHSIKPHPAIAATLLDFLCRINTQFYPKESNRVRDGIFNSLKQILDKRVLPTLAPLLDNNRLDAELRARLRECFGPFVGCEVTTSALEEEGASNDMTTPKFSDDEDEDNNDDKNNEAEEIKQGMGSASSKQTKLLNSNSRQLKKTKKKTKKIGTDGSNSVPNRPEKSKNSPLKASKATSDDEEYENSELPDVLKDLCGNLRTEKSVSIRCELVDSIVENSLASELDYEQCTTLASQLSDLLQNEFEKPILSNSESTDEQIEEAVSTPVFVLFRALTEMSDDPHRSTLLTTMAELYSLQPRIGYYLLFFLAADKERRTAKEKAAIYKDLCEAIDEKYSLDLCLINDMRQCQEDDVHLFVYLLPEIYTNFPKATIGNTDLLYLLVSCVDGRQVHNLIGHVVQRDFLLFKKDTLPNVLSVSLTWETFEQYVLWQLIEAHDLPIDCMLSLVPKLNQHEHSEAATAMLLRFKQERPTTEFIKLLLTRDCCGSAEDKFVLATMSSWIHDYNEKTADLVASILSRQLQSSGAGSKRKRNNNHGLLSPSAEVCLRHLTELRQRDTQSVLNFFGQRSLVNVLQQARNTCSEVQKTRFVHLFAVIDSDSEDEKQQSTTKRKNSKRGAGVKVSESSDQDEDDNGRDDEDNGRNDDDSDEEQEEETTKGSNRARRGRGKGGVGRKRAGKVSYKISSEDSSAEEDVIVKRVKRKRRHSGSD